MVGSDMEEDVRSFDHTQTCSILSDFEILTKYGRI